MLSSAILSAVMASGFDRNTFTSSVSDTSLPCSSTFTTAQLPWSPPSLLRFIQVDDDLRRLGVDVEDERRLGQIVCALEHVLPTLLVGDGDGTSGIAPPAAPGGQHPIPGPVHSAGRYSRTSTSACSRRET